MKCKEKIILKLITFSCIIIILLITFLNLFFNTNKVQAALIEPDKQYTTICVSKNDTLWGIADEYMNNDYYSYESYIKEVISINNIIGDKIYAGETIIIPILN